MTKKYCITHEMWLMDWEDVNGLPSCILTTSAPPELPDNWEKFVPDPSVEELKRMDLNAEELLIDAIGAGLQEKDYGNNDRDGSY